MKIPDRLYDAECWEVLGIRATGNINVLKIHFNNWCKAWYDSHNKSLLHQEVYRMTEAMMDATKISRIIRKRQEKIEGKRKFPDEIAKENWDRFELRMLTAKSHIDINVAKLYYSAAEANRLEIKRSLMRINI